MTHRFSASSACDAFNLPSLFDDDGANPCDDFILETHTLCDRCRNMALKEVAQLESDEMTSRYRASMHLREFGRDVIPLLLQVLHGGYSATVREGVLDTLKQMGDRSVVEEVRSLRDSSLEGVRLGAVRALRWLTPNPEPFLEALEDDAWRVRREAVFALSDIARDGGDDPRLDANFDALMRLSHDAHPLVRAAAVNGMGRMRRRGAAPRLLDALDDEHERVRAMAIWSLQHMDCREVASRIIAILERGGGDDEVTFAARALGDFRATEAVGPLLASMEGVRPDTHAEIVVALGKIGGPEARRALQTLAETARPGLRRLARWGLAEADPDDAAE